jgi:hypothetical protein
LRLPTLIKDFEKKDIFNADETGLYWRALPEKSLVQKGDASKGIKIPKDRVTLLVACSATGEKLPPLMIGKAATPRCFRGHVNLPICYMNNKKAWMTAKIWAQWLDRMNTRMIGENRNILLFVDNCAAHPDVSTSNIKVVFLPPNTTSHLQPCDAGM